MKKQTVAKKVGAAAKSAAKKTGVLMKKAGKVASKEAVKVAGIIKKEWIKSEPKRAEYKAELKVAAKKAGAKGMEILKIGLKNSMKIGSDVANVINKDLKEISEQNKKTK